MKNNTREIIVRDNIAEVQLPKINSGFAIAILQAINISLGSLEKSLYLLENDKSSFLSKKQHEDTISERINTLSVINKIKNKLSLEILPQMKNFFDRFPDSKKDVSSCFVAYCQCIDCHSYNLKVSEIFKEMYNTDIEIPEVYRGKGN